MMKRISLLIFITLCFAHSSYSAIKVASYNIRTFDFKNSYTNKTELKKIIKTLNADLITVEEIINHTSFVSFLGKNFPEYDVHLSRCGGGGKQKIGFVYRKSKFSLEKVYEDNRLSDPGKPVGQYGCGRLRPALVGIFKEKKTRREFVAIGLHLKAGGSQSNYQKRELQYDIVNRMVEELRLADYKDIILMGDLNTTGYILKDEDYKNFRSMLHRTGMTSASSQLDCTAYWAGENRSDNIEESSILDHILHGKKFLGMKAGRTQLHSFCKKSKCDNISKNDLGVQYKEVSDHCPVSVTFK